MLQHWLDLEEELQNSFSVIAIHTGLRPYRLAYALNKHLDVQLKRSKEDLDLKRDTEDLFFPLFEFKSAKLYHQYDLIGNRSMDVGKTDGVIHYEEIDKKLYGIGYLIPEHKTVDYFLKIDFNDNYVSLEDSVGLINKIKGVQSAYILTNSRIKSINNLIFD